MKKLFTLAMTAAFMLTATVAMSQSQRMAFVEEATQASCPPCAAANPVIQSLMNANSDKAIFLGYQVWWPGFDQMYLDNEADVDYRIGTVYGPSSAYAITGAPNAVMNGQFAPGSTDGGVGGLTQAAIDEINGQMSEFDLDVEGVVVDGNINVTGTLTATAAAAGTLKLHLVLTEGNITIAQAPGGTNGETEYHHVMKKFLPGVQGITLSASWVAGDTYIIDESYSLADLTIYNWDDLEVIAFVQNEDDSFIHQAAKDGEVPITVSFTNNGAAGAISGVPAAVCSGSQEITPSVTVQNTGNDDLTSLDFTYSVNGGTPSMWTWNGAAIATLGTETIELPAITFVTGASNTLDVAVSNPNGMTDEDLSDNNTTTDFGLAPTAEEELTLTINFDCWPQETGWELRSSAGTVIASAAIGTYAGMVEGNVVENLTAPTGECYSFIFMDEFGDGLHGAQWANSCTVDGNMTLEDGAGNVVYSNDGSYDAAEETEDFESMPVGIEENHFVTEFGVAPNPISDVAQVRFEISHSASTSVDVLNMVGQVVYTQPMGQLTVGQYNETLDMSDMADGVYFVRIVSGGEVATAKVTVAK